MDDWMPGISVEVFETLRIRYGPDFNKAFELWRGIDRFQRFQEVKVDQLAFQVKVEDKRHFVFCLPPDLNLWQIWGPASLCGALFLMGARQMTLEKMLEELIDFAESRDA